MSTLVENILVFGRVLRAAGLPIHSARLSDSIQALEWVGVRSRADVRAALRSLLVHRHEDLSTFDEAFDLFFRARSDPGSTLPLFSLGEHPRVVISPDSVRPDHVTLDAVEAPAAPSTSLAVGAYSPNEVSRDKDFGDFTASELEAARRLFLQRPWTPAWRRSRRWRRAPRGALDLGRLLRLSVMRGGTLLDMPRRARRRRPRPIVILADVSGSMERYSRVLISFAAGLARTRRQVEIFLFATRLTRVTRQLRAPDGHQVLDQIVREVQDWGGGTRIGEVLRTFNTTWARRVMRQGPVVLILSDGWDRGDPQLLDREMRRLTRTCSRVMWLNPLLGSANYEPLTRGIHVALRHVHDHRPIHNLASVEALIVELRRLPPRHHGPHRHLSIPRAAECGVGAAPGS